MSGGVPVQSRDIRGFFMLPQAPEDAGYYVYGTPGNGAAQYAHPAMMTLLFMVEREWALIDRRKFGIGNISIAGGGDFGHKSHRKGLEVDIRPLRKDGLHVPVSYLIPDYDFDATAVLIQLFRSCAAVPVLVFFNDNRISGTHPLAGHDNHFHVQFQDDMKPHRTLALFATAAVFSLACAGTKKAWDGSYTQSSFHYLLYSNDLDEAQPPTRSDQRLSVAVTGELARQMFEAIGPDLKLACGTTLGMRQRQQGDVDCSYDKDQPASPYTCHFGVDLRNGKSIAGATC